MKNNLYISGIIIVCLVVGYYLATNIMGEDTAGEVTEETNVESESNTNGKNDGNEENNDSDNIVQDSRDYEEEGKECKAINDTIERGDCFQDINEYHMDWYVDTDKSNFHFPEQHEQDHWKDIFYYEIDDTDELSDLHKTDYYEDYTDPYEPERDNRRGKNTAKAYWKVFSGMIPQEYRTHLKYVYYTDTSEDSPLGVDRDEDDPEKMILMLSDNTPEYDPFEKYRLIHEFGHILTLNEQQVKIDEKTYFTDSKKRHDEKAAECETYFIWGCPEEDSYLHAYYNQFWDDIFTDFEEIDWDEGTDYKEFFLDHSDRFMNSYQGTNPVEDIADAFAQFVMTDSRDLEDMTLMKYDKLQFFYDYDELVELRTKILENMYDISIRDNELY